MAIRNPVSLNLIKTIYNYVEVLMNTKRCAVPVLITLLDRWEIDF